MTCSYLITDKSLSKPLDEPYHVPRVPSLVDEASDGVLGPQLFGLLFDLFERATTAVGGGHNSTVIDWCVPR